MIMYISEEEKKQILSKYQDNTSDEFLRQLIRTYPVDSQKILDTIVHFITIDDKRKILTGNKKLMVNKIFNLEDGKWSDIDEPTLRRTIKKYIDGIKLN